MRAALNPLSNKARNSWGGDDCSMETLLAALALATSVAGLAKALVELIRTVLKTRHKADDR